MRLGAVHVLENTGYFYGGRHAGNINIMHQGKKEKGKNNQAGKQQIDALYTLQHFDLNKLTTKIKLFEPKIRFPVKNMTFKS